MLMILNISNRTDIIAYYSKWLINRYNEGYVDVRNPYYQNNITRIYFKDVDALIFTTKNPIPIIPYLNLLKKTIIFYITITPYHKEIEPNVINKKEIINAIKKITNVIDKEYIYIRYDPIFISKKYTIEYHIKSFNKLCNLLNNQINHIIISFLDEYKNTKMDYKYLQYKKINNNEIKILAKNFGNIAKKNNMTIQTCNEVDLTEYGFVKGCFVSKELIYKLTNKKFKKWKARNCNCIETIDIGEYNSCPNLCRYCYANFEEKKIIENYKKTRSEFFFINRTHK